jgi:hypothetical protein
MHCLSAHATLLQHAWHSASHCRLPSARATDDSADEHLCFVSSDIAAASEHGLIFCGRSGQVVKVGGRFVHLASVEACVQVLSSLPWE